MRKSILSFVVLAIFTWTHFLQEAQAQAIPLGVYIVKPGDTLSEIAVQEHTTVEQIKTQNHLRSDTIYIGQTLRLSGRTAEAPASSTYTVAAGDSLSVLAYRYHVTVQAIRALNSLDSDLIRIGQILHIPASGGSGPTAHLPLQGKTIVISPGHGGSDRGAEGNGIVEKNVTLEVGLKTEADLKAQGARVVMVRTGDQHVSLDARAALAAQTHADLFVSIHVNDFQDPAVHGSTTYFNNNKYEGSENPYPLHSYKLAKDVVNELSKIAGTTNRGAHSADYRVLRENSVPSTLVEIAFLSNRSDAAKLKSGTWLSEVARGITSGIDDYFGS